MSNEYTGKIKSKRKHASDTPYKRNKSILGRVGDTVKDMLSPSWLVDLVNTVKKSPTKIEAHIDSENDGDVKRKLDTEYNMTTSGTPIAGPSTSSYIGSVEASGGNTPSFATHTPLGASAAASGGVGSAISSTPTANTTHPLRHPLQPFANIPHISQLQPAGQQNSLLPGFPAQMTPITFNGDDRVGASVGGTYSGRPSPQSLWTSTTQQTENTSGVAASSASATLAGTPAAGTTPSLRRQTSLLGDAAVNTSTGAAVGGSTSNTQTDLLKSDSFLWAGPKHSPSAVASSTPHNSTAANRSTNKPKFNITAFNSAPNLHGAGNSETRHKSPYYEGRTAYGGAASVYRKPASAPYQVMPVKRNVRLKSSQVGRAGITSSHAKRILDSLEKMASPLNDAKKIPDYAAESSLALSPATYKSARVNSAQGPPTNQVSTPAVAKIATNRSSLLHDTLTRRDNPAPTATTGADQTHTLSSQYTDTHESSQKSTYIQPTTISQSTYSTSSNTSSGTSSNVAGSAGGGGKTSGKMRTAKSSQHYSSKRQIEEDEQLELPDLPIGLSLPITTMPTFSFNLTKSVITAPLSTGHSSTLKPSGTTSEPRFTFSSPIHGNRDNNTQTTTPPGSPLRGLFEFSKPLGVTSLQQQKQATNHATPTAATFSSVTSGFAMLSSTSTSSTGFGAIKASANGSPALMFDTAKLKLKPKPSPAAPVTTNGPDTPLWELQPPAKLKQGSVMDILGGGNKKETNNNSSKNVPSDTSATSSASVAGFTLPTPVGRLKSGSVMDILGGGKKTDTTATAITAGTSTSATSSDKNKTLQAKPIAQSQPSTNTSSLTNSIGSASFGGTGGKSFGGTGGKWECPTCLIQNNNDVPKCVACETVKPSAAKPASSAPKTTPLVTSGKWECQTCLVQNDLDKQQCVACTTAKPSVNSAKTTKTSSGSSSSTTWECPTCMIVSKKDVPKCPACMTSQPGVTNATNISKSNSTQSLSKSSKANWDCDTCLVVNKSTSERCVACETPRPGSSSRSASSAFSPAPAAFTSSFNFNENKPKQGSFGGVAAEGFKASGFSIGGAAALSSGGGPKFGGPSTTESSNVDDKNRSKDNATTGFGGVKFDASKVNFMSGSEKPSSNTDSSVSKSSATTFKMPTTNSEGGFKLPSASGTDSVALPGGFKFGSTSSIVEAKPKKDESSTKSEIIAQSVTVTSNSAQTPALPVFNFGKPATSTSNDVTNSKSGAAPVVFGSASTLSSATSKPADTTSLFTFGQSPATGTSTSTALGVPQTTASTTMPPAVPQFNFGGIVAATSVTTSCTTTTSQSSTGPVFNFKPSGADSKFGSSNVSMPTTSAAALPTAGIQFNVGTSSTAATTSDTMPAPSFTFGTSNPSTAKTTASSSGITSSSGLFGSIGAVSNTNTTNNTPAKLATAATLPATGFSFNPTGSVKDVRKRSSDQDGPDTKKPSGIFASAQSAPTGQGFAFGGSNGSTGTGATFNFGGGSNAALPAFGGFGKSDQSATSTLPVVGSTATTTTTSSSLFGGAAPAFGTASNASSAPAFGSVAPSFGTNAAATANKPVESNNQQNSGLFTFGSSTPAFQSNSNSTNNTTGFNFGTADSGPSGSGVMGASASGATGFNFGPTAASGQAAATGSAAAPAPVFNFGGTGSAAPAAATAPPQQNSVFQFNAGSTQAPAVGPDAAGNPFNASAPAAVPGRKIKRAVRKIQRK